MALYVHRRLKYKIINNITLAIDVICECIYSIEMLLEKKNNMIVSCVDKVPLSVGGRNVHIHYPVKQSV